MTRKEVEGKIRDALAEIAALVREYCPEDDYLTMTVRNYAKETSIAFNNTYWDAGAEHKLDYSETIKEENK